MLRKWVLSLCISVFAMTLVAAPEEKAIEQTMFELERSVAILQLSKANLEDYKSMNDKVMSLENRVDFFAVLTLVLCFILAVLFVFLCNQHKRLLAIEKVKMAEPITEE
ncbi:hypothetical protein ACMUMQ_06455 [Marinomonas sp. 2405UD66-6]|uniref:hypothetical protein n=1 Tax=Marinomonas sp. 2405UD66-6 TaxID=3391834 RepID=UPI0039C9641E